MDLKYRSQEEQSDKEGISFKRKPIILSIQQWVYLSL